MLNLTVDWLILFNSCLQLACATRTLHPFRRESERIYETSLESLVSSSSICGVSFCFQSPPHLCQTCFSMLCSTCQSDPNRGQTRSTNTSSRPPPPAFVCVPKTCKNCSELILSPPESIQIPLGTGRTSGSCNQPKCRSFNSRRLAALGSLSTCSLQSPRSGTLVCLSLAGAEGSMRRLRQTAGVSRRLRPDAMIFCGDGLVLNHVCLQHSHSLPNLRNFFSSVFQRLYLEGNMFHKNVDGRSHVGGTFNGKF